MGLAEKDSEKVRMERILHPARNYSMPKLPKSFGFEEKLHDNECNEDCISCHIRKNGFCPGVKMHEKCRHYKVPIPHPEEA